MVSSPIECKPSIPGWRGEPHLREHRRRNVVGGSVLLAARRARARGVALLSGGYGRDELERAGAYRVYENPLDLMRHLDEVGVRSVD